MAFDKPEAPASPTLNRRILADAEAVFDAYVEAGGNLGDTADVHAGGGNKEMLGAMIERWSTACSCRPRARTWSLAEPPSSTADRVPLRA
ncbi:hypothetical protein GRZ55_06315 [Chelativorans sp. ZYF759]|uniref:hypothetical protein n=1 Tax=Chelativorans sp. ZYF759 TaxID=2692213 RepID=UPI00145D933D|nr:hypothetical protein [Chelativorans sp. ZYF759]NMG38856.1 hypothetical protein [Chelativorans sp. ZYF759]